ncbi:uncharacterized protein [Onthophagus taurus]|uniref:uncharacterized protein n=1 Tax=Onthophagus taurus TaxID=166361 RepID=UPI000C2016B9|nr:uncharacterized protein LOC111417476 [Onthophagus taurus]
MNLLIIKVVFWLMGCCLVVGQQVTYTFKEFPYKEHPKNEALFREYESACEQGCNGSGVSKVLCVRQCISPSCYRDLYSYDPLEEGEVDVRLNSFKGCFIQRYNKFRP